MFNSKKIGMAVLLALGSVAASAHTTSLGYVAGANNGEVTFWAGHYDHGDFPSAEGSGQLDGVTNPSFHSGVVPFNDVVSSKPVGLIDGVNNFFWNSSYEFGETVDPHLFGGIIHWESITITGLNPGVYDFLIADDARTTQEWANLSELGGDVGTIRITLKGTDIGGGGVSVPEPTTIALLGLGLAGLVASRRRQKNQ